MTISTVTMTTVNSRSVGRRAVPYHGASIVRRPGSKHDRRYFPEPVIAGQTERERTVNREEQLEILACDLGKRPPDAPTIDAVTTYILAVSREDSAVVVTFDRSGAGTVEDFVEAERLCCPSLDWQLTSSPDLILR